MCREHRSCKISYWGYDSSNVHGTADWRQCAIWVWKAVWSLVRHVRMHFMYLLLSILFISAILSMKCFITLITAVGVLKFELPFQFSVFWYFLAFSQPIKTSLCNSSQKFTLFGVDLWSLLFLLYNDIVTNISSEIRLFAVSEIHLFADDCIVYRTVTDQSDCMALQADIDILLNCSNTWKMKFNPSRCHIPMYRSPTQ